MQFLIPCDRLMHNYLHKKLHGAPLSGADPVGHYLFLMTQCAKRGEDDRTPDFTLRYAAQLESIHGSRRTKLLNATECQMLRTWTKYALLSELMAELDDSDDYTATFEAFQERYDLCDLDISRDEMYKWYERIHSGFTKHQFLMPSMLPLIGWPPDHMG